LSNLISNNTVQTLDSREIAEMTETTNSEILKKLEGTFHPDGRVKQVGIIPILSKGKIPVSDYFIKSSYKDESGKENKCYLFTKMGCEFIANKFTGEKGILFTAKYVERFNQMEKVIQNNFSINEFKVQLETQLNELVENKLTEIETKCSQYYRPVSKEKQNIVNYIKKRLGIDKADNEYELVKQRVLIKLNASKWEDIPVEKLASSLNVIDESIRIIKMDRPTQACFFD
jgi:phage regulator Rha-like protein